MKKIVFLLIIFALSLAGCSTTKIEHTTSPVYVTNTKVMYLLPLENMEGEIDSYQLLNGRFGDSKFTLLCYMICNSREISIDLLNDFGTDMGNLQYDGSSVNFTSAVFPENLKAEYILLDIQNAYYQVGALQEAYKAVGLSFEEEIQGETVIRKIKNGKKIIELITKNGNSVKIQNNLRGYEYNLTEGEE